MTPEVIAALVGPLVGAGAGTYFGLKGALNGLKESTKRAEAFLGDIRDSSRLMIFELQEHRKESQRWVSELKHDVKEVATAV